MKHLVTRASAAVLVAAAALTAACSNNDPMAPQAPQAARTPSSVSTAPSNFVGANATGGVSIGPVVGPATGGATTNSGYIISWSKDGQPAPTSSGQ